MLAAALLCAISQRAQAQDVFRNPAMEENDEFQQTFNKARMAMRQGDFDEAINQFKNAAKMKDGKCAECFQMIGQVYLQGQQFKDAAAAFRQAIELKPANEAEMYNALGVALYLENDKKVLEEAAAAFNRAIELSNGKIVKAYYNLGYTLIKAGKEEEGKAALKKFLELEPAANEATAARAVIANPKLAGARFAPGFTVKSSEGKELSLEKLKGRIVLLDFWASWCGPCRAEMPEVKKIWKKYGGDNFIIIGVNLDRTVDAFENYVKEEGLTWPQVFDANSALARQYNVYGIPHTVLIDQDGIIRAVGLRAGNLSNKVGELLKSIQKQESAGAKPQ